MLSVSIGVFTIGELVLRSGLKAMIWNRIIQRICMQQKLYYYDIILNFNAYFNCGSPFTRRLIPHSVSTLQGRISGTAVSINFGVIPGPWSVVTVILQSTLGHIHFQINSAMFVLYASFSLSFISMWKIGELVGCWHPM